MHSLKTGFVVLILASFLQDSLRAEESGLDEYYRPDRVQSVRLTIEKADWQRMMRALPKRIYVPGSFQWRDVTFQKVGVRFKGNSSSNPRQPFKRSFLVRFDKYDREARFYGLRRVSFDNGIQFGSLFSEPIITDILRAEGIKSHRANYATLHLNGEYRGVYVNVERIDDVFLERHWPGSQGPLFKVDEGGPGCNLQLIGDDPKSYGQAFESKNDEAKNGYVQLLQFIRMINQSPADGFAERLNSELKTDDFLKVTAVMLFSGAFDQLTGWNPHNYYLYRDRKKQRWTYLPWDLDVGFSEVAFGRIRVLDDWHAGWPHPRTGSHNPLLKRVLTDSRLLKTYRTTAKRILETHFEPDHLERILDTKYALIREDLKTDPFPHRRVTCPTDRDYDDIVASIRTFMRKRYESARAQLADPGRRPTVEPLRLRGQQRPGQQRPGQQRPGQQRPGQTQPGPPSKDAPTKLQVVKVDETGVTLRWVDNAQGEAGTILQRANGENGGLFQNLIGQPGDNVTQATDSGIRPGATYRYRVYSIHQTPEGMRGTGVSNVVLVRTNQRDSDE